MKCIKLLVLLSLSAMTSVTLAGQDDPGGFLSPDVDEPPEEIYEPLNGIGSRVYGSDEIEESRALREEAKARRSARHASPEFREHVRQISNEVPIADGTGQPVSQPREPARVQRRSDGSLVISDQE